MIVDQSQISQLYLQELWVKINSSPKMTHLDLSVAVILVIE